jgi:hypothetical protein
MPQSFGPGNSRHGFEPLLDATLEAVLVDGGDERPPAEEQRDQADADGESDGGLVGRAGTDTSIEIAPFGCSVGRPFAP